MLAHELQRSSSPTISITALLSINSELALDMLANLFQSLSRSATIIGISPRSDDISREKQVAIVRTRFLQPEPGDSTLQLEIFVVRFLSAGNKSFVAVGFTKQTRVHSNPASGRPRQTTPKYFHSDERRYARAKRHDATNLDSKLTRVDIYWSRYRGQTPRDYLAGFYLVAVARSRP